MPTTPFIVSEDSNHGMQVFDLTRLRNVAVLPETFCDAYYNAFGSAHNIAINEATGYAYVRHCYFLWRAPFY